MREWWQQWQVLEFICQLCDPGKVGSAEEIRALGLTLANMAIEIGGVALGKLPWLVRVLQDDLCRCLLINSRSPNLAVLSLTLRVVHSIYPLPSHRFWR